MPTISYFFGIFIRVHWREHGVPHFHAYYNEYIVVISIKDFSILEGALPPRPLGLVMEWAAIHKQELIENYELGKQGKPFKKIEPLQ
jgi:hypothetical protein